MKFLVLHLQAPRLLYMHRENIYRKAQENGLMQQQREAA